MAISLRAVVYIKQLSSVVASAIISSAQVLPAASHPPDTQQDGISALQKHIKNQHQYNDVLSRATSVHDVDTESCICQQAHTIFITKRPKKLC